MARTCQVYGVTPDGINIELRLTRSDEPDHTGCLYHLTGRMLIEGGVEFCADLTQTVMRMIEAEIVSQSDLFRRACQRGGIAVATPPQETGSVEVRSIALTPTEYRKVVAAMQHIERMWEGGMIPPASLNYDEGYDTGEMSC